MKGQVMCVLALLATGTVVVAAPAAAVDLNQMQAMKEEARARILATEAAANDAAKKKPVDKAVLVRCDKGQSVQAALDQSNGPVTIEIQGICEENVRIERRSDVTLRGKSGDPGLDGLKGVPEPARSAALEIRYADRIRVEDLSFNGGASGGVYASYARPNLFNCQLNDNAGVGLSVLFDSYIYGDRVEASRNGSHGFYVAFSANFVCWQCDLNDNAGWAQVYANRGALVTLWDSVVTGWNGLYAWNDSYADVDCLSGPATDHGCELRVGSLAGWARAGGAVGFGPCEFEGQLIADGGEIALFGARQVGIAEGLKNELTSDSLVFTVGSLTKDETDFLHSSLAETDLGEFSRAIFHEGTDFPNAITCSDAADAVVDAGLATGGNVIGCPHVP